MSRPCVFECSDGEDRVLKFQNRATKAALASDWIGALLATDLGIRTPAPALVKMDEDAIATMGNEDAADAEPGYAFGATYLPNAQNTLGIPGITSCSNHADVLGRLAVLDTWIGTEDRLRPDGVWNLLRETDQGSRPQLVAIDFGLAFPSVLTTIVGATDHLPVELVCPPEARLLVDSRSVADALAHAKGLTEAEVITRVETTPDTWLTPIQRGHVIRFLLTRREALDASLEGLEAVT